MSENDYMNDKFSTGVDENLEKELPKKYRGNSAHFFAENLKKKTKYRNSREGYTFPY